jgi:hypothetical protein
MKTISNILAAAIALAAVLSGPASAQQSGPPEVGFIRIIHALAPGTGKANMFIDGEDIFPKGYDLGQRTGGMGIKAGTHKITIKKEGLESGTTQVTLKTGETLSLIAFAEKVPAKKEGDPPVWIIRILRLKQSDPERGYRMTLVSVCDRKEVSILAAAQGKGTIEKATVERLKTTSIDLGNSRGEVLVKAGDEIVTTISPEDPGNYVVVLYQDAAGMIKALSYYDPKFVIAG